ncbi:2-oxoglutarate-dependent dioxygenase DAO-like [Punica granatum]|uniref:2-oxoglutarate-dependent dioxygenase DAO-like n=1 Tax=Punica granatum TaxID=22663 RepID=A0A218W1J4_PUNGR|nr:2-oxoglutarate-dependent dioxygenase DAO-like [Punica granatum]OWM66516.1 hypothetical protein CDL15_Pgr013733 [Punica granatum]
MGEEGRRGAIPVIDMKEIPFQHMKLREACEEWGCFRVVNHGVPLVLMSEMKSVSRSILDLPLEVKKRYECVRPRIGHIVGKENAIYESLGLYDLSSPESLKLFCSQLDVSSHQRETLRAYTEAVTGLAMEIGDRVARSMGLEGRDFFKEWACQFRMNKYSFTHETVGSGGLLAHTDPGLLTVLQDDEVVGGLEIADSSNSFIHVDSCPGTFLVNLGDTAVAWSNGRLRSVKHRVQCKEPTVRISIGGFVVPPKELAIKAPAELVDCHPPRLYIPFTYDEYKQIRSSNKMPNDEALSFLLAQS